MATMTVSLPDPMKDWIEEQVRSGHYASTSDYVRDLVRRDRERKAHPQYTLAELKATIDDALASGAGGRRVPEVMAEAREIWKRRTKADG